MGKALILSPGFETNAAPYDGRYSVLIDTNLNEVYEHYCTDHLPHVLFGWNVDMRHTLGFSNRRIRGSFGAFWTANGHSMGAFEPRKRARRRVRDHLAWS